LNRDHCVPVPLQGTHNSHQPQPWAALEDSLAQGWYPYPLRGKPRAEAKSRTWTIKLFPLKGNAVKHFFSRENGVS